MASVRFFGLGLSAGTLNTGILHAISSAYRLEPAATINLAGAFFGLGSAIVALLVAGTFNVYTVSSILFLVAIAPALFAVAVCPDALHADRYAAAAAQGSGPGVHDSERSSLQLFVVLPVRERVGDCGLAPVVSDCAPGFEPDTSR